jgi:two-component system phosphate regulon sensor histidine kinase PhoR
LGVIYPSFLVVILLTIVIISFSATSTIRGLLFDQTKLRLQEITRLLRDLIDEEEFPRGGEIRALESGLSISEEMRVVIYDAEGEIIYASGLIETETLRTPPVPAAVTALSGEEASSDIRGGNRPLERVYYAVPLERDGEIIGAVETSLPITTVTTTLESTYGTIILVSVFMLLGSILVSYYASLRIDRPLKKIAAAARRYRDFDFSGHPYITGPEEIHVVSEALRSMSDSLQERIQTITGQKQELQTILNGMVEAVILLDENLTIKEVNPAAELLIKRGYEESVDKSLLQVLHNSELYDFASEALSSSTPLEKTLSMPEELDPATLTSRPSAKAGRLIHLQVHASAVNQEFMAEGLLRRTKRVVLVLNDITRMKNLERIRKDFVANVSHELKTPITSIKGFAETLLEGALEDEEASRSFVSIIRDQSERLVAIIEDLLSLSRLEQQDEQSFEREESSIAAIINGAVQVCSSRAQEKGSRIEVDCPEDLHIYGNGLLIEQALVNLIDNAVKYSPPQTRVEVSCRDAGEGVYVTVRDNGPGIPQKDLSRVFERFYRVDKTRSRELGGTGLGLAIVKHIVISHGGEVTVESEYGGGSDFTMFFPHAAAQ